jgi:hypothetical protein
MQIGKHLSDAFLTYPGLKRRDALLLLLFNLNSEYNIRKAKENQKGLEME